MKIPAPRLFSGSIRRALFALPIIVLVPVFLLDAWFFLTWYRTRLAHELAANVELARGVAMTFDAYVSDLRRLTLSLGQVLAGTGLPPQLGEQILRTAAEEHPTVSEVLWVAPTGRVLRATVTETSGMDVGESAFFKAIKAGRDWWVTDLMRSPVDGRPAFVLARGVRDPAKVLKGVVVALIDPGRLADLLALDRPGGGSLLLLDRQRRLVYRYPEADIPWKERELSPSLQKQLREGGASAALSLLTGERRLYGFASVRSIDWVVAASRPSSVVTAPILREFRRNALVVLGVSTAVLIAAFHLARSAQKPVSHLVAHARALSRGELHRRAPREGPAELREIAAAFNEMAERLQERGRALAESEERLRLTNEAAEVGLCSWEPQAGTFSLSPRGREIMELPLAPPVSIESFLARIDEADRERVRETLMGSLRGLSGFETEYGVGTDEGQRTVLVRGGASKGREGSPRILAALLDITRRRRYEEAVARERAAELLDNAKSEFMALASHELHTPLNVILGYTDLLLEGVDGPLTAEQRRTLERLASTGWKLRSIADAILDLSRLRTEDVLLSTAELRLRETLEDGLAPLAEAAAGKGLEFALEVNEDVPDVLVGDADRLLRALTRLVDNAVRFTDEGRVAVGVSRHLRIGQTESLHFTVTDTGVGIPEEDRLKILRPFEQVEPTGTRSRDGIGLGLPIAMRLIEGMGGHLWLESETGAGSAFHFTACFSLVPSKHPV